MPTALPIDGIDVHAHVLDAHAATVPGAAYGHRPGTDLAGYEAHLGALGLHRGVLVAASIYGHTPDVLLATLRAATTELVGVAVPAAGTTDADLDALAEAGVRGVRLQDLYPGGTSPRELAGLGARLAERDLHVEIWTDVAAHLDWLPDAIAACPATVVLDHLAWLAPEAGPADPALATVVALARDGHVWITASGAYRRLPEMAPADASEAMRPVVHALAEAVPDRLLWGSDWPFVGMWDHHPGVDELLAEASSWFPDDALRRQVLVTNPAEAYRM